MSFEQLTGRQMDVYERIWTRVMLASGAMLITALVVMYVFWNGRTGMLVCGALAVASLIILSIAAAKLRELERGSNGQIVKSAPERTPHLSAWTINNTIAKEQKTVASGLQPHRISSVEVCCGRDAHASGCWHNVHGAALWRLRGEPSSSWSFLRVPAH